MKIDIRMANLDDLDKLIELRNKQQIEDLSSLSINSKNSYDFSERTKQFLKENLNNRFIVFVAEVDSIIAANVCLQIINLMPLYKFDQKIGYICNVYTEPCWRRKGIQTKLFNTIDNYAKENYFSELWLESDNPIAIYLYNKIGFSHNSLMMTKYFI